MHKPAQRCARLVAALEDLAAQEECALREGDYVTVATIQERAGAVIGDLGSQSLASADPALRDRLAAIRARRALSSERLAGELTRLQADLADTKASKGRVTRIAPVYGSSSPSSARVASRLACVG